MPGMAGGTDLHAIGDMLNICQNVQHNSRGPTCLKDRIRQVSSMYHSGQPTFSEAACSACLVIACRVWKAISSLDAFDPESLPGSTIWIFSREASSCTDFCQRLCYTPCHAIFKVRGLPYMQVSCRSGSVACHAGLPARHLSATAWLSWMLCSPSIRISGSTRAPGPLPALP